MKPKISKTHLPADSRLHMRVKDTDFLDCYKVASTLPALQAAEIIVDFPMWAKTLVALRNIAMSPYGLMRDGPAAEQKLGLFPVEFTGPTEIIAGFNDRHLNFRVSVMSKQGYIFLATWVHTHNLGGRYYLKTILPFHILIVRNALARVASAQQPRHKFPVLE